MLEWDDTSERYAPGWFVGSEDDEGASHRRGTDGWPYSIYKQGCQPGVTDAVLCHGIQDLADAEALCRFLNTTPRLRTR